MFKIGSFINGRDWSEGEKSFPYARPLAMTFRQKAVAKAKAKATATAAAAARICSNSIKTSRYRTEPLLEGWYLNRNLQIITPFFELEKKIAFFFSI